MIEIVKRMLRPGGKPGRLLITAWKGDADADVRHLIGTAAELNLKPFVCADIETARFLSETGDGAINTVAGDFTKDVEGTHNQFSVALVPGYEIAGHYDPSEMTGWQLEWTHVRAAMVYMLPNGILAFTVAMNRLQAYSRSWLPSLLQAYRNVKFYEYDENAVLIIGQRKGARGKSNPDQLRAAKDMVADGSYPGLPEDDELPGYDVIGTPEMKRIVFRSKFFDPYAMEAFAQKIPWGADKVSLRLFGFGRDLERKHLPMVAKMRQIGAIAAAGWFPPIAAVGPDGHLYVFRGRTERRVVESSVPAGPAGMAGEHSGTTLQQTGDFVSRIAVLDVNEKKLEIVDPDKPREMLEFIERWSKVLAVAAQRNFPPLYDPENGSYKVTFRDKWVKKIDMPFFGKRPEDDLSGTGTPSLARVQRHVVAALVKKSLGGKVLRSRESFEEGLEILLEQGMISAQKTAQYRKHYDDTVNVPGKNAMILAGGTGVGKTLMSLYWARVILEHYKETRKIKFGDRGLPVGVFITRREKIPEFCEEVRMGASEFQTRVVERPADVDTVLDEAVKSPLPTIMVIPRSMFRRHWAIRPVAIWGDPPFVESETGRQGYPNVYCCSCRSRIRIKKPVPVKERVVGDAAIGELIHGFGYGQGSGSSGLRGRFCDVCGEPLFEQYLPNGTYSLARCIRRAFKRLKKQNYSRPNKPKHHVVPLFLVVDEIHEDKGESSKQGISMGWLADMFRYNLALSATVTNGRPSGMFELFRRFFPWFREKWKPEDLKEFISMFGNWTRAIDEKSGDWKKPREAIGFSPELIPAVALEDLLYIRLDEVFDMVPKVETPLCIELSDNEKRAVGWMKDAVKAKIATEGDALQKRIAVTGSLLHRFRVQPSGFHLEALAEYSPAWKCPECGLSKVPLEVDDKIKRCRHKWLVGTAPDLSAEGEDESNYVTPVLEEGWISSKEKAILELVRKENQDGRVPILVLEHTGEKYQLDQRYKEVCEREGLRVLDCAGMKKEKLQKVINLTAATRGADVVISNVNRVGASLSLTGTPTLIFGQPIWSVQMTTQAAGRPHRPAQKKDVRIIYSVAKGTAEEVVLARAMEGVAAASVVSGDDISAISEVMEATGHVKTLSEVLIDAVASHVEVDLETVFSRVNASVAVDRTGFVDVVDVDPLKLVEPEKPTTVTAPELDMFASDPANVFQLVLLGAEASGDGLPSPGQENDSGDDDDDWPSVLDFKDAEQLTLFKQGVHIS